MSPARLLSCRVLYLDTVVAGADPKVGRDLTRPAIRSRPPWPIGSETDISRRVRIESAQRSRAAARHIHHTRYCPRGAYRTRTVQRGRHREMPDVRDGPIGYRTVRRIQTSSLDYDLPYVSPRGKAQSPIAHGASPLGAGPGTGAGCGTPDGISVQPYCVLEPGMQSTNGSTNGYAGQSVHQLARVHPTAVKRIEWHSATCAVRSRTDTLLTPPHTVTRRVGAVLHWFV